MGFDGEYINTKTKAFYKCKKCGYVDKKRTDKLINAIIGCKMCNGHATPFTENSFKEKCKSMNYEFIGFVGGEYKNGKSKLIYKCNKCGKIVTVNCRNFMKGCYRGCCKPKQHLSGREYLDRLKKICEENNYELLSVGDEEEKIGVKTKVKYECGICGNITETDVGHIVNEGTRCPGCRGGAKINKEIILRRINERCDKLNCIFIRFLNDENEYKNNITRVLLKCKTCGYEWGTSYAHFIRDTGCPKCGGREQLTIEEAIERAFEKGKENNITVLGFIDGEYKNNNSRLKLICNVCGHKWDAAYSNFMIDRGCPKCAIEYRANLRRDDKDIFIEKARGVHGYKYDYSKVVYKNSHEYVTIICPEHGEFPQIPNSHLRGAGCPACNESHLEREVRMLLEKNNIDYIYQCKRDTFLWLGRQSLDFYIPQYNVAIECQGGQHFMPVSIYGGEEGFTSTVRRDNLKKKKCDKHGIKIFYYSNLGIEYPYQVYEDFNEMIKDIKHYSYFKNLEELLCEASTT
jgi:hypothetical protein